MRIIDADKLIVSLKEYLHKPMTAGLLATIIELQPTAYNINKIVGELETYKELEKQELLLKLPCKVGDKIYEIENNYIYEFNAKKIEIRKENEEYIFRIDGGDYKLDDFGRTVFLTQEEAEKHLQKMEG